MAVDDLRQNDMMAHLLDALEQGQDIGHYGRLIFVMVGRHFMPSEEVVQWLCKDPDCGEEKARGLVEQVEARGYNPPKRERILEVSLCASPCSCASRRCSLLRVVALRGTNYGRRIRQGSPFRCG